jgi:uncharacterized protein YjbI with pentapeptide repeats
MPEQNLSSEADQEIIDAVAILKEANNNPFQIQLALVRIETFSKPDHRDFTVIPQSVKQAVWEVLKPLSGSTDLTLQDKASKLHRQYFLKDSEVLELLQQGIKDFRKVDLSGLYLSGLPLNEIDFSGANLTSTKLRGSDLSGSVLNDANLAGADLSGANVNGTKLSGANLTGAILTNTNLKLDDRTEDTDIAESDSILDRNKIVNPLGCLFKIRVIYTFIFAPLVVLGIFAYVFFKIADSPLYVPAEVPILHDLQNWLNKKKCSDPKYRMDHYYECDMYLNGK